MRWRETACRALALGIILGLAIALVVSLALGFRWLREPTYQQRINALGNEDKAIWEREKYLLYHHAEIFQPEEFDRITRAEWKKRQEIDELKEEATRRYRNDPLYRRLEPVREDLRRRLGW